MDFYEVLDQVLALLRSRGRVTYRALKRQFNLDDAFLDDLKAEVIKGQRLAVDEDGEVLVWSGDATLPPPSEARAKQEQGQSPLTYTPSHLAEKIRTVRPTLEGERKRVTVLFADLKGSTELIQGLDGVGKSRLVYEFVHSHHAPGWLVLESASVSYGKARPYFPVLDLLRRYCHLDDTDDTRTIQAKVTGQILTLDAARVLLLVNYRPEYQHGWGSKTYYTQVRLDLLPPVNADEFFQTLLGSVHDDLIGRRHIADYTPQHISAHTAERCLRKATEMVTTITSVLEEP
jgi:hypothetical protein